jgi:hypothetical protein
MSNELSVLLQSNPALVQTGLDDDTLAVAGGAGGGGGNKRISIKGGVFRKYAGGKEVASIEDRFMNVIFVKMAHDPSRTWYEKAFKEGEKVSPSCWSSDSKVPDADVKNAPASSCNECPNSVKGSGNNGQGTACRLSWRTAVVLPSDPSGDIMQLVLPATSAFGKEDNGKYPFRPYIQMLANHNVSAGRVVTKMQFDTKATAPKVMFSPAGAVEPAMYDVIKNQGKSVAAEAAIKLTVYQQDTPADEVPEVEQAQTEEPVKRESTKPVQKAGDVTDVVKKWSTKKE